MTAGAFSWADHRAFVAAVERGDAQFQRDRAMHSAHAWDFVLDVGGLFYPLSRDEREAELNRALYGAWAVKPAGLLARGARQAWADNRNGP